MPEERRFRLERDSLGEKEVPLDAYYGIQTLRASENFRISGLRPKPVFIKATAMVKMAACNANESLGLLDRKRARAISKAAKEITGGRLHDQFIVDVFQAGAGTSHNMNANEVIANRAIELLGGKKGDYAIVHPNDHVNASQSTNDTMPTALRVAAILSSYGLIDALRGLEKALKAKAGEFYSIIKSGRTHLQDAVPMTLGQEFGAWASAVRSSTERIERAREGLFRIGLGATAIGTGINSHPLYRDKVLDALRKASGVRELRKAEDTFEALNSSTDFSSFSGSLRDAALDLIRIANDIRLLASGPRTGIAEISLPPAQPGQLQLNVMLPVINYNLLHSIEILTNAAAAFTSKCVRGIRADAGKCERNFESSEGLATILNCFIGYEKAAEVVKESLRTGKTVKEIVIGKGILTEHEWDALLDPKHITRPMDLAAFKKHRRAKK